MKLLTNLLGAALGSILIGIAADSSVMGAGTMLLICSINGEQERHANKKLNPPSRNERNEGV